MKRDEILKYMYDSLGSIDVVEGSGDQFIFYDPENGLPKDHRFPFATIVDSDNYDTFSNLNRPSMYRLNMGIGKATHSELFREMPSRTAQEDEPPPGYDYTPLDCLLPHPVYGRMYWVCVLNPSDDLFRSKVQPLLAEAYELAADQYARRHRSELEAGVTQDVTR